MVLSAKTERELIISFLYNKYDEVEKYIGSKQGLFISAKSRENLRIKETSIHLMTTRNTKLVLSYEKNKMKSYIEKLGERKKRISLSETCAILNTDFDYNVISYQDSSYLKVMALVKDLKDLKSPLINIIFDSNNRINNNILTEEFIDQQILTNPDSNYFKILDNIIEMKDDLSDFDNSAEDISLLFDNTNKYQDLEIANGTIFQEERLLEMSI